MPSPACSLNALPSGSMLRLSPATSVACCVRWVGGSEGVAAGQQAVRVASNASIKSMHNAP